MTLSADRSAFLKTLAMAAKAAGAKRSGDSVILVDEVWAFEAFVWVDSGARNMPGIDISVQYRVKPLAIDEILWAALFPDADLGGPAKRLGLRFTGAFTVGALALGSRDLTAVIEARYGETAGAIVAELVESAKRFRTEADDLAGFLDRVSATLEDSTRVRYRLEVSKATTLIALGRQAEAATYLAQLSAQQESGGMRVGDDTAVELLFRSLGSRSPAG